MEQTDNDSPQDKTKGKWFWAYRTMDVVFWVQVVFLVCVAIYFVFG